MTDAELVARLRANVVAYKQFQASQGSLRSLPLPGVCALAQPQFPNSLVQQQVIFEDAGALEAALPTIEDFYRSHGVRRWQVVVPPGSEAGRFLGLAGYQPEGGFPSMGLSLEDFPLTPPRLPVESLPTIAELISLNDEAFGQGFSFQLREWHSRPFAHIHARGVREGGRLISGGLAHDVEDTAGIFLVATLNAARNRGLATEVMRSLLLDARARGRGAAVLQSTELGYRVYLRLGFRDLGLWVSWVHREG